MFNATDFTYDGTSSTQYGIKIATLDSSVVEETAYVSPAISMIKPTLGKRFMYLDSIYDEQPTFEFSIIAEQPISDRTQRDILRWLDNRRGFRELKIQQPEIMQYVYHCVFNVTSIIYHAGSCIGFNLKATFDSQYHYKESPVKVLNGDGSTAKIEIFNDTDIIDDYVYPTITFKAVASSSHSYKKCESSVSGALQVIADTGTPTLSQIKQGDALSGGAIGVKVGDYVCPVVGDTFMVSVFNETDSTSREFRFSADDSLINDKITVDNELKIISGSGTNLLAKFDGMKWLRLRKGKNVLRVTINGEFTITFPQYIKIRF